MSFSFNSSRVTINGKDVSFSSDGNAIINGEVPELNGPEGPVVDPIISQFVGLNFFQNNQPKGDKIVSEGCTENGIYKVRLGIFDAFRQERAWVAYKERILTETGVDTDDQVNHLLKAAKSLNKLSKKNKLNLEEYQTAGSIEMANKLQEFAKQRFIAILRKKSEPILKIDNGRFKYRLDSAMRHIHLALIRIFQEVNFSDNPEQFKGIEGTAAGHSIIWKYLSDSLSSEDTLITTQKLKLLARNLLVTPQAHAFGESLVKKLEIATGLVLVSDLNKSGAKAIADTLQQEMVMFKISEKAYPSALEISKKIADQSVKDRCHLLIADGLWDEGSHRDAIKLIGTIDSDSTKGDWYVNKANLLWGDSRYAEAIELIGKVYSDQTKSNWYQNKSNLLWQAGNRKDAVNLIGKIYSDTTKDNWYVNKADLLWQAGERIEAVKLIGKIYSDTTKGNWYVNKADLLWQAGERKEAVKLVGMIYSDTTKNNWYVNCADLLWQSGGKKEAKELIKLVSSDSTKNNWINRKFNEL